MHKIPFYPTQTSRVPKRINLFNTTQLKLNWNWNGVAHAKKVPLVHTSYQGEPFLDEANAIQQQEPEFITDWPIRELDW